MYNIPGWATIRSIMVLIRGVGSLFPCPWCLIPEAKLGNYSARAALRTTAGTKAKIQDAQGKRTATERKEVLEAAGLRDVDVHVCSYYSCFVLLLMTLRGAYSGRSTTRIHITGDKDPNTHQAHAGYIGSTDNK